MKKDEMSNETDTACQEDELRPEYTREDLGEGERGKLYDRYKNGTNLIKLEKDVAHAFPDTQAVNDALRLLMRVAGRVPHEPTEQRKSA